MTQVSIKAIIKAKPGKEDIVKRELMSLLDLTRAEKGCLNYDLHQCDADGTEFLFYENWEDQECFDRHLQATHVTTFLSKADELLAEPLKVVQYKKL